MIIKSPNCSKNGNHRRNLKCIWSFIYHTIFACTVVLCKTAIVRSSFKVYFSSTRYGESISQLVLQRVYDFWKNWFELCDKCYIPSFLAAIEFSVYTIFSEFRIKHLQYSCVPILACWLYLLKALAIFKVCVKIVAFCNVLASHTSASDSSACFPRQ